MKIQPKQFWPDQNTDKRLSTAAYDRLRRMREQIEHGEELRPGSGNVSTVLVMEGIIRELIKNSKHGYSTYYEFTTYGWLFACRESLWEFPSKRGDMHTAARHWKG